MSIFIREGRRNGNNDTLEKADAPEFLELSLSLETSALLIRLTTF
jgi:hypothetical protein